MKTLKSIMDLFNLNHNLRRKYR